MDVSDHELLEQFTARRGEDAFRQLVERHVGMVYSVAYRVTGDAELSKEITQSTFTTLARKADSIDRKAALAGWLYHTARNLSLRAIRSEQRRRQREQIAAAMNATTSTITSAAEIAEHLESAMGELKSEDRDAIVLRFFEDRNLRDIGHELGLSEDAARMRIKRALEKLRGTFAKLGLTGSITWLATVLPTSASVSVPAGLGASITTAILGGTAVATTTAILAQTTSTTMHVMNAKVAAALIAAAAVTGTTTYLVKNNETNRAREEALAMAETQAQLRAAQEQSMAAIQLRDDQIEQLQKDAAELPRLRGEIVGLRRQLEELANVQNENARLKQRMAKVEATTPNPEAVEKTPEQIAFELLPLKIKPMRNLGLEMIMHATANEGWFPSPEQLQEYWTKSNDQSGLDQITITFRGRWEDIPARERSGTIVARETNYSPGPDGQGAHRVYVFADGSTRLHGAQTLEELTAWENERIIPLEYQSPRH